MAVWAFWPTLESAGRRWLNDAQYSHGYLVPLFSLVLLWIRSEQATQARWGVHGVGLGFLTVSLVLRLFNLATWNMDWLDGLGFVLAVQGVFGLVGGRRGVSWSWPATAFLLLMLPLPYRVERLVGGRLQGWATDASTFVLQLLGLPAATEGKTIVLNDLRMGVAEACSGLSMLMIFVALASGFAIVVRRPVLDRLLLLVSAVPIALAVNILRITATGVLHVWVSPQAAELVFHDLAGWLMMPLALGFLWVELKILSYVLVDDRSVVNGESRSEAS